MHVTVVLGATGGQGGSVVSALLGIPSYNVRAVTRNPPSAEGLDAPDVDIVPANLDSQDSLLIGYTSPHVIVE